MSFTACNRVYQLKLIAGSGNQSSINDRACLELQATVDQLVVLDGKNLLSQVIGFKQVAKYDNGTFIRQARGACVKLGELTKQSYIVQLLFHGRIRKTKLLLKEMNTQHSFNY